MPQYPIREGEKGAGAVSVGSRLFSRFACVHARVGFLIWGEKAHGEARGATFLPFYSAEIGFLSEKRSEVVQPQLRCGFRLKMETRWRDLPAKLFTRGFSFKKEMLWHNLPAKFYECGASSKKEGSFKNRYFNKNSSCISIEQWEIHVKS